MGSILYDGCRWLTPAGKGLAVVLMACSLWHFGNRSSAAQAFIMQAPSVSASFRHGITTANSISPWSVECADSPLEIGVWVIAWRCGIW